MTDTEFQKIMAKPAATTSLPFNFDNGFSVCSFTITCGNCGRVVPMDNIKGDAQRINDCCTSFVGYALCHECRTVTPLECRFRNDGTYLCKDGAGWRQGLISIKHPGLFTFVRQIFNNLFALVRRR